MSDRYDPPRLTPSICEEALQRFSESDDSLAGIIQENHIEIRDFMILSFVCDQRRMSIIQLSEALGLSTQSVVDCTSRLLNAGLIAPDESKDPYVDTNSVVSTSSGRMLTRRILGP